VRQLYTANAVRRAQDAALSPRAMACSCHSYLYLYCTVLPAYLFAFSCLPYPLSTCCSSIWRSSSILHQPTSQLRSGMATSLASDALKTQNMAAARGYLAELLSDGMLNGGGWRARRQQFFASMRRRCAARCLPVLLKAPLLQPVNSRAASLWRCAFLFSGKTSFRRRAGHALHWRQPLLIINETWRRRRYRAFVFSAGRVLSLRYAYASLTWRVRCLFCGARTNFIVTGLALTPAGKQSTFWRGGSS